jgi:hypothetical protein
MSNENPRYRDYIGSSDWSRRKTRAKKLAGYQCQYEIGHENPDGITRRCSRQRYLCVHHLTYDRLGNEADEDLEVLCWIHHLTEHLMWFKCEICQEPILESYTVAEAWLMDELRDRGIDRDHGPVNWNGLPTKEGLRSCLPDPEHCTKHRTT